MKKRSLRHIALLCCAALLTLGLSVPSRAEGALLADGFENYASQEELQQQWVQTGTTQVGLPQLSTDRAHSGAASLLLNDTEADKSIQARCRVENLLPEAEFVLSTYYYLENASGVGRTFTKLYCSSGSTMVSTYSSGRWDPLSTILTVPANGTMFVFLGSNVAPTGRIWFDDVTLQPLTEALALDVLEEKLSIPGAPDAAMALRSRALGLTGVQDGLDGVYALTLRGDRTEKGAPLTRAEVQACVDEVNALLPSPTDAEIAAAAAERLSLSDFLSQPADRVTADLAPLPAALDGGLSVSWQALDPATGAQSAALSASGRVVRPAYGQGDAPVLLRATLQKGGASASRDFFLIVSGREADDARLLPVVNPGFEQDAPADETVAPAGWIKEHPWIDTATQTKSVYANVDTSFSFTGGSALRLTAGTGSAPDVQSEFVWDADEGHRYRMDVMACAAEPGSAPSAVLNFRDNEGLSVGSASAACTGAAGAWQQLTAEAVAPVGTVAVTVNLKGGSDGAAWFDDVRVREYPLVRNGSFALGADGWTGSGTAADGALTLTGGAAAGAAQAVTPGQRCFLSGQVSGGGTLALRFASGSGTTLATVAGAPGETAVWAHVPSGAATVAPVLTGPGTFSGLKITLAPYGTAVADGGFEDTAGGAHASPWTLSGASAAADTGRSGAGLTVGSGGSATSNAVPVLSGKRYIAVADVKGAGTLEVSGYSTGTSSVVRFQRQASASGSGWTTLTVDLDPVPEIPGTEIGCLRIKLSGAAVFDNVAVYPVAGGASNASMEILNGAVSGTFPLNWCAYGPAAAHPAHRDGQASHGIKGLAVESFGLGEGGVRSSMVRDIVPGETYEASVQARGTGTLSVRFYGADFAPLTDASLPIGSRSWQKVSVVAAAPAGAAYAALSVSGTGTVYADEAFLGPAARPIGQNTQLFFDDYLIGSSDRVTRTFHEGEKTGPLFSGAFGTRAQIFGPGIIFDPDALPYGQSDGQRGVYKMWYQNASAYRTAYAESTDGVTWTAPALGLVELNGSTNNNMCAVKGTTDALTHLQSAWLDREESDPDRRYKAIAFNGVQSTVNGRYCLWVSPDGFTWEYDRDLITGQDVSATVYDPYHKQFVGTFKVSIGKRTHRIAVSRDLLNWSTPVRMYSLVVPQDTAGFLRADGYGGGIYPVGDSYVGFSWRYRINEITYGGVIDAPFLFSRDLTEDWQSFRKSDGTPQMAVSLGAPGEFDCGMANVGGSVIDRGDELWFYYTGWNGDHNTGISRVPSIGAAKWRRDGFVSMDFSDGGTLTTAPFVLEGERIHLNAAVNGSMDLELLDEDGAVAAVGTITGDRVEHTVLWDRSIAALRGRAVSLRITADDAALYSLRCDDAGRLPGDLTGDGKVNGKDVSLLQRFLAGGYGVTLDAGEADLNGDGKVNGKDVSLLQRFLAGGYGAILS